MTLFHSAFLLLTSQVISIVAQDVFSVTANWWTDPNAAPFTYMQSTMVVPPLPSRDWETLFIWPGLQSYPRSKNFEPVGNGVLQPVLSYGPSCAPNKDGIDVHNWWISAQYVNIETSSPTYRGCFGGAAMPVNAGDTLVMTMELIPGTTIWLQTITNLNTYLTVAFNFDLGGQSQAWAEFVMETPGGWHANVPAWKVKNIVLKTDGSDTSRFCKHHGPKVRDLPGASLSCTEPVVEGNTCKIDSCSFNGGTR